MFIWKASGAFKKKEINQVLNFLDNIVLPLAVPNVWM